MSSPNPTAAATPAARPPQKQQRRSFLLRALLAVLVLAAIAWTLWYFLDGRWYEDTDDAYVGGNVVQITPQIPGTVVSIGADDGDLVRQGEVLVKLDKSNADVALAEAKANLAATVRKVRGLYSSVNGQQALVAAQQQYQTSKVLVDDTVVASHPDVEAAAAKFRAAYLDDERTTLVAPVTGYVAMRSVQLGQRVAPGTPLMAVVPLHEVWIDANFKETQLTHMRIGQPVEIESDVYGGAVKYRGKVQSLGIGTGSAFALLPAQNATGNWIKIVQRIPVRVVFTDPKQLDQHPLRIGMSLAVSVSLHDRNGPMLAQQPPTQPAFSTDVYEQQAHQADALIAGIIHANMAGGSQ